MPVKQTLFWAYPVTLKLLISGFEKHAKIYKNRGDGWQRIEDRK